MKKRVWEIVKDRKTNYWANRIIPQIEYACKLSKVNNGAYDEIIRDMEESLIDYFRKNGAITKDAVNEAEEKLSVISNQAKKYKMIFASHAHIDMNWQWGWHETVAITLDTFRTMLDLLNEYPEFKFSQSQASVYYIVEEHDPEMLEEIKKKVKEGRWEVTASTWVETDKNMPNGESLARHILYTKKYLSELFDIDPEDLNIDFEPDTFGHNLNVPEILSKGGVKFYYHCRGNEGISMYKWKSPSGNSVIVYLDPYWYNGFDIDSFPVLYVPEFCSKYNIDTMLKVYGVGDHGGGPTRRDIERIMDMSTWPVFPEIRFGTFKEYFSIIEKNEDKLPILDKEFNVIFDGCYTSQSRIKLGNKMSEVLLNEAETFSSATSIVLDEKYPGNIFEQTWRDVLFNQFHDILPGSCTADSREYSIGLYQKVFAKANAIKSNALRKIAANIDTSGMITEDDLDDEDIRESTSEGAGAGFGIASFRNSQCGRGLGLKRIFHFFNPSMKDREEIVEVIIWNWDGDADRIIFTEPDGTPTEHCIVEEGFNKYFHHYYIRALVKVKAPACGYSTYILMQAPCTEVKTPPRISRRVQKLHEAVLENNKIKVTFNPENMNIVSLINKSTGEELIDSSRSAGVFRLINEDDTSLMSSWIVGRYKKINNLSNVIELNKVQMQGDSIREEIVYKIAEDDIDLQVRVYLDEDSSFVKYDVTCNWRKIGKHAVDTPQLSYYLPVNYNCDLYKYGIPFGVIERKGMNIDVPSNGWVFGQADETRKSAVMLLANAKYGFRSIDNSMAITLLRSSARPDLYPEIGVHKFSFAVGVVDNNISNNELVKIEYDYSHPVSILSVGKTHKGIFGSSERFMRVESGSIIVSGVKMPEKYTKDKLVIRLYETDGNDTSAVISFYKPPKRAYFADINEKQKDGDSSVNIVNNLICFPVKAYNMETLVVEF